jgi:REP element-mobilizing transposase RayT
MARKLRIQYAGAVYHVMNRGDRREAVFGDEQDYEMFLRTLGQACAKALWQVHAYCLMPNHFHLVIETPQPTLIAGMKWLLGTYTGRFNRRHRQCGHLFSGRYKAQVVDGSGNGYLKTVCDYAHLNPARARLLRAEQPLQDFPWSSYPLYLRTPRQRPPWLRVDRLLGEWRIPKDSASGRRLLAQGMERRRVEDTTKEFRSMERGWCLGDEEFKQELLEEVSPQSEASHDGEAAQEAGELRADRLVKARLKALGWTAQDLATRRKGDPAKVKIAAALRAQTTMPLAWIAERLAMGSRGYLTWLLYRQSKSE